MCCFWFIDAKCSVLICITACKLSPRLLLLLFVAGRLDVVCTRFDCMSAHLVLANLTVVSQTSRVGHLERARDRVTSTENERRHNQFSRSLKI